MLSKTITEYIPGVIATGPSKKSGEQTALIINKCFRNKTLQELEDIESNNTKGTEERMIRHALNKASVDKNILFFLPYNFSFEKNKVDVSCAKIMVKAISDDLKSLFSYRRTKVDRDSYIGFIADQYFVLAREENNEFVFYDMVKTSISEVYCYLFDVGTY